MFINTERGILVILSKTLSSSVIVGVEVGVGPGDLLDVLVHDSDLFIVRGLYLSISLSVIVRVRAVVLSSIEKCCLCRAAQKTEMLYWEPDLLYVCNFRIKNASKFRWNLRVNLRPIRNFIESVRYGDKKRPVETVSEAEMLFLASFDHIWHCCTCERFFSFVQSSWKKWGLRIYSENLFFCACTEFENNETSEYFWML